MQKDRINMALLSLGRLVSDLGTWVFRFALSLYILDVTGSAAKFSFIFGLSVLPPVLINIFAGVLADKFDRKKIIVLSDLLSGIAVASMCILFVDGDSNILLFSIYVLIVSALQAFFQVSISASVPNIVEEKNVMGTNSLIQGIGAIVNVLGPLVGAILYGKYGLFTVMIIDAFTYILSGCSEMFIKFRSSEKDAEDKEIKIIFKEALRYLNELEGLKSGLLLISIFNFLLAPIVIMGATYVSYEVFNFTKEQAGIVQSSYFIGSIIGAVFLNAFNIAERISGKIVYIISLSSIPILIWYFVGISPTILASYHLTISIICVSMALLGIITMLVNIPMFSILQIKIPDDKRASIFGIVTTLTSAVAPLGIWICGIVFEFMDWSYVFLFIAISILVSSIFFIRNKEFQKLILLKVSANEPSNVK